MSTEEFAKLVDALVKQAVRYGAAAEHGDRPDLSARVRSLRCQVVTNYGVTLRALENYIGNW